MKLTSIVTFVAVIGAKVALASPIAQQAPVKPNPAGVPARSCCSGYSTRACCKTRPHLLPKDILADPSPLCFKTPLEGAEGLTAETIPCTTAVETKAKLCFASDVAGLDGLTAATVPCPTAGAGVVSQISDGQVQAPVSATGNPVSLSTVQGKGAADIVGPTASPTFSTSTVSPTQLDTSVPTSLQTTTSVLPQPEPSFVLATFFTPSGATEATWSTLLIQWASTMTSSHTPSRFPFTSVVLSSSSTSSASSSAYSTATPALVSSNATELFTTGPVSTHKPYPTDTYIGAWDPTLPGAPTSGPVSTHKPYPTDTYIGAWDPTLPGAPTNGPVPTHKPDPTDTYRDVWDPIYGPVHHTYPKLNLPHFPFPTTLAAVAVEERAVEESTSVHHVGPGWSHTIAHQPFPTDNSIVDESTSVHHVGPGWSHTIAHQPLPTTLATVFVEQSVVEESTSVHHVGPGWSHSLAHRPLPTDFLEKKEVNEPSPIRPGFDHTIAWRPLPTGFLVEKRANEPSPIRPGFDHTIAWRPLPTGFLEKKEANEPSPIRPGFDHTIAWRPLPTGDDN
ncbi:MAG: hypothetical protein Q9169_004025 [Polycauliona sp. 2 TL-2023]